MVGGFGGVDVKVLGWVFGGVALLILRFGGDWELEVSGLSLMRPKP